MEPLHLQNRLRLVFRWRCLIPGSMKVGELIRVPIDSTSTKNMGEKKQKNLLMGYSAAYPAGRERCLEVEEWVS